MEQFKRIPEGRVVQLDETAWVAEAPKFVAVPEAARLFELWLSEVPWSNQRVCIRGQWHAQPRRVAYFGDEGSAYSYSGAQYVPLPWRADLEELRKLAREVTGIPWTSALLNLYRDGKDSIGAHKDNEPELGPLPPVAALSFGATRTMIFRRAGRFPVRLPLVSGSLLLMGGTTQRDWTHEIPKESADGPRISVTFRAVRV